MKFLGSLFLLLTLTACQTSLVTDLAVRSGDILFMDNFSAPSSGWTQADNPKGVMGYDGGALRMLVLAANYDLWSHPGQVFHDVRVEVDVTRLEGPLENRFGLVCRYRDGRDFYFFIISSDGYYAIGKVRQGERALLGQAMMAYSPVIVPGMGPNHLRFDCIGKSLTGYVNGQTVAATQDADLAGGDVGLLAGSFNTPGVDVAFDNFVVQKP
jgi:hypothetical protein